VFGCGPVAAPARSWVQPVTNDRVIVRCNDSDTAWTLVCDGDVWRSTAGAVSNCSTTAALTGDSGASHTKEKALTEYKPRTPANVEKLPPA